MTINYQPVVIKINGTPIKQPSDFKIERYNLTKSGRVASGAMTMELVAKKRKFFFTYQVISGKDFQDILNLIDGEEMFFDFEYEENGVIKTAVCYVGAIPSTKFRVQKGTINDWYWKDVNFDIIEQ